MKIKTGTDFRGDFQADKTPDVYCMTRITFGDTPSPLLSIATVQNHVLAHEEDYPVAAKEVKENMHIDDILTGAPDNDCAVQLKDDLCNLLSKGGFSVNKVRFKLSEGDRSNSFARESTYIHVNH